MYVSNDNLREFLLDAGLVSKVAFDAAIAEAERVDKPVGDILVARGDVSEDDLRRTYAYIFGIPFVNLAKTKIPYETLSLVPEPIARRNNIIAYNQGDEELEVAMRNTDDLASLDFIKKTTHLKIQPRLTDTASIKAALRQYQRALNTNLGDVIRKETQTLESTEGGDDGDLRKIAEGVPAVRIVDMLLKHAIAQNVSDIHIEPMESNLLIRYRIDGILHDAMELPKNAAAAITARIKVLSNLRLDEKRLPQDGRFATEAGGERVSLRVSLIPVYYGEKIVMRLLREGISGFTLEGLGFHGVGLERLHTATKHTTGMVLATGPTGSGKSTTLYTILDLVNTPSVNIATVEDPIEYQMSRINQTQVRPEIGFTFASGLRSLLRQDPDVIMVGEIRDRETASLAINASLTGHLVLSTLHTNSAAGAIPRLVDMGVEPFLIVSTLDVVVGQRLVRKLCGEKEEYALSRAEMDSLESAADLGLVLRSLKEEKIVPADATWKTIKFYRPKPSDECADGYAGRIGIHEILAVTPTIKQMVANHATDTDIAVQARKEGMLTMIEDGIFKAAQGVTSIEEVLRVIAE